MSRCVAISVDLYLLHHENRAKIDRDVLKINLNNEIIYHIFGLLSTLYRAGRRVFMDNLAYFSHFCCLTTWLPGRFTT